MNFAEDPGRVKRVKVRFSRPVAPGDTVTIEGKVTKLENGVATAELSAKNQRQEEVLRAAVVELG